MVNGSSPTVIVRIVLTVLTAMPVGRLWQCSFSFRRLGAARAVENIVGWVGLSLVERLGWAGLS